MATGEKTRVARLRMLKEEGMEDVVARRVDLRREVTNLTPFARHLYQQLADRRPLGQAALHRNCHQLTWPTPNQKIAGYGVLIPAASHEIRSIAVCHAFKAFT